MPVLVIAEHDNKSLKAATLNAVTAAQACGEVHVLVAGKDAQAAAQQASQRESPGGPGPEEDSYTGPEGTGRYKQARENRETAVHTDLAWWRCSTRGPNNRRKNRPEKPASRAARPLIAPFNKAPGPAENPRKI